MTGTTANFAIPYPVSTDPLCSLADTLSDAGDAICSMLTSLQASVDFIVNRAAVKISSVTTQALLMGTYTPRAAFDTVDFDTVGTTDLSVTPTGFVYPEGYDGTWFTCVGSLKVASGSGGNAIIINTIDGNYSVMDLNGSLGYASLGDATIAYAYNPIYDAVRPNNYGSVLMPSVIFSQLEFTAIWLSDN